MYKCVLHVFAIGLQELHSPFSFLKGPELLSTVKRVEKFYVRKLE